MFLHVGAHDRSKSTLKTKSLKLDSTTGALQACGSILSGKTAILVRLIDVEFGNMNISVLVFD